MRSLVVASIAVLTTAILVATSCSYPDFRYGDGDGDDDSGGAGQGGDNTSGGPSQGSGGFGGMGPATSSAQSSSAMSSASTGIMQPRVWCKETLPEECPQGQICCYHDSDPAMDKCAIAGTCGANFIQLSCDSQADCPSLCCGTTDGLNATGTSCAPSCTPPNAFEVCDAGAECADGTCDAWPNTNFPYPNYGWCVQ